MFDTLHDAWRAFTAIPYIHLYVSGIWIVYMVWLGGWIVLQKREPVATLSWLLGLAALPVIGLLVYQVFGPQKIKRHRLRRSRSRNPNHSRRSRRPKRNRLRRHRPNHPTSSTRLSCSAATRTRASPMRKARPTATGSRPTACLSPSAMP